MRHSWNCGLHLALPIVTFLAVLTFGGLSGLLCTVPYRLCGRVSFNTEFSGEKGGGAADDVLCHCESGFTGDKVQPNVP